MSTTNALALLKMLGGSNVKGGEDDKSTPLLAASATAVACAKTQKDDVSTSSASSSSAPTVDERLLRGPAAKQVMRDLLISRKRIGSLQKRKGFNHAIAICTFESDLTCTAGGVFQQLFGWAQLIASTDYTLFAQLFDIVRVKSIGIAYGAKLAHAVVAGCTHQPMLWGYRPDDLSAATYVTLAGEFDMTNKADWKWTNTTSPAVEKIFHTPGAGTPIMAGTSTLNPTLGNWLNTGLAAAAGGVQVACHTDTGNVSVRLGDLIVCYVCEFAFHT